LLGIFEADDLSIQVIQGDVIQLNLLLIPFNKLLTKDSISAISFTPFKNECLGGSIYPDNVFQASRLQFCPEIPVPAYSRVCFKI
jgi:hypothetical protein